MKAITVLFIVILNIHLLFLGFPSRIGESLLDYQDTFVSKLDSHNQETSTDVQDQEFPIMDPDIFLRKLDQKKLLDLNKKEKIIWSFKMSVTDLFL